MGSAIFVGDEYGAVAVDIPVNHSRRGRRSSRVPQAFGSPSALHRDGGGDGGVGDGLQEAPAPPEIGRQ